jgi:hypothetical protein
MLQSDAGAARARRAARTRTAHWAVQVGLPAQLARQLTWSGLADVPTWTCAPGIEQDRLALLAGALASAGQMRLWIDGERITQAIALLGDAGFEQVLASEIAEQCKPPEITALAPLRQQLLERGATVLLASIADEGVRRAAAWQMKCSNFKVDHACAVAIIAAATQMSDTALAPVKEDAV